jgi:hypothetical protein
MIVLYTKNYSFDLCLDVELKTKNKKNYFDTEIELKESLLNNNNKEDDYNNENDFNLNIELRVANNPDLRPSIPKKYEKKNYFEFIDLMKKCWKHEPKERPGFNEITMTLQEILENIKK